MTRQLFYTLTLCLLCVSSLASQTLHGFIISGNPASSAGASWTYRDTVQGVVYDLNGILFKPGGSAMWPAVVISHGHGQNVANYSAGIAKEMRAWGLVCIATNYTHAAGVSVGSPGDTTQPGASMANILRARKCVEIVSSLGYVDAARIAAHGYSMGAFVTAGVVGTFPLLFRVASHTAGGLNDQKLAWTKSSQANGIITPYQIHHGDNDSTVALADDQRLDSLLQARGVDHQMFVYPGYGHTDIPHDSLMLQRVRSWYSAQGLFLPADVSDPGVRASFSLAQNYPNPFNPTTTIHFSMGDRQSTILMVFDLLGRNVATLLNEVKGAGSYAIKFDAGGLAGGVYFYRLQAGHFVETKKLILLK